MVTFDSKIKYKSIGFIELKQFIDLGNSFAGITYDFC